MSSRKPISSRDAALSNLTQQRKELETSRLLLLNEIQRIDNSLKQNQAEYAKIFNDPSPLLSLPTEVTCMIFDLSVAICSLDKPGKSALPKSLPPEVAISHVCNQWRHVSLNYPRLWTRFFFRAKKVESIPKSLDRFDEYIKRSGSQNLELFFDFEEEDYRPLLRLTRLKEQLDLLDMAIKQVERWKIVTLMATPALNVESRFLDLKFSSVPNLEYFVYSPASPYNVDAFLPSRFIDISNPRMFSGGAPKLRYLLFDCSRLTLPPLSNITTLRLESLKTVVPDLLYTWETFLAILSIPSLANLSLVGHVFITPGNSQLNKLGVINMKTLKHLRYSNHDFMTVLLPSLRAPLLETLVIHNDYELLEGEVNQNALDSFAGSYFFPSLETLTLINVAPMDENSARRIMNLTKNVKSIHISHEIIGTSVVGFLHEFNEDCWPRLASITANVGYWNRHQVRALLDLIRSRPKDACLKLRLFKETHSDWKTQCPKTYRKIQKHCTVEVFEGEKQAETALMRPRWPPGVDCPDYPFSHDPFRVKKASRTLTRT